MAREEQNERLTQLKDTLNGLATYQESQIKEMRQLLEDGKIRIASLDISSNFHQILTYYENKYKITLLQPEVNQEEENNPEKQNVKKEETLADLEFPEDVQVILDENSQIKAELQAPKSEEYSIPKENTELEEKEKEREEEKEKMESSEMKRIKRRDLANLKTNKSIDLRISHENKPKLSKEEINSAKCISESERRKGKDWLNSKLGPKKGNIKDLPKQRYSQKEYKIKTEDLKEGNLSEEIEDSEQTEIEERNNEENKEMRGIGNIAYKPCNLILKTEVSPAKNSLTPMRLFQSDKKDHLLRKSQLPLVQFDEYKSTLFINKQIQSILDQNPSSPSSPKELHTRKLNFNDNQASSPLSPNKRKASWLSSHFNLGIHFLNLDSFYIRG